MSTGTELFTSAQASRLRRNLRRWHESHGRPLPWRQAGDAYRVWISEIMLQQTTVAAVVPYYEQFLTRFPDLESLAAAGEEEVLRLWEGLGYYSRARNIHKTAQRVVEDLNGEFPANVDELCALPGIGRYTAGAIASFAFDQRAPIVEANTLRLYCRLLGFEGDPRSGDGQRLLWLLAEQLLPQQHPGEFNQALIDLGATVCTISDPDCPHCPLRSACRAFAADNVSEIPRPKSKVAITETIEASVAVHRRGAFLLRRRGEGERWAGLWDFLRFDLDGDVLTQNGLPLSARRQLVETIRNASGLAVEVPEAVQVLRHSVTRYRITLHCLRAPCRGGRTSRRNGPLRWVKPRDFDDYPLSVTGRRFARILSRNPNAS